MPRRKQDKPQHLEEEDNNMDQLVSHPSMPAECRQEGQYIEEDVNHESKRRVSVLDQTTTISNSSRDAALSETKDDRENRQEVYEEDVEEETEPAVIGSEEWLNVKATLASLQQQMQILRLQHFKFMQRFASQNHISNTQTSAQCESDSVPTTNESNQDQVLNTPVLHSEQVMEGCNMKTEMELDPEDGDEKLSDIGDEDIEPSEQSPSAANIWPENDDQGEPISFDCTHCSAVLPSPELLKIHMFSHQRREAAAALELARGADKAADSEHYPGTSSANHGSAIQSSSSFPSLPPSYQSIINDLSNDSLEDYMEIQKPENTHLEHLVKNMDGTVTDPNQCLICKRILSCKSALMMHYRTHTGERPFKCKLCSRAFTTKGNLKTHMGVHRAKPPLRLLHNCVVCNKQFTNALVLNQHMKMHSDEAAGKRSLDVQGPANGEEPKRQRLSLNSESSFKEETPIDGLYNLADLTKKPPTVADFHHLSAMGGGPSLGFPFEFGGMPIIHDQFRYAEAFARQWEQLNQYPMFNPMVPVKPPPMFSTPISLPGSVGMGIPFQGTNSTSGTTSTTTKTSYPNGARPEEPAPPLVQLDKPKPTDIESDEKSSVTSQNEKTNLDSIRQSASSPKSDRSWDSNDTSSNSVGVKLDPPPGTSCDICLKAFACRSALEIHYRSHTKHRPFKCDLCDKSFTTRGNMKQHILTHKTDDMHWNSGERSICMQAPSPPNSDIAPLSIEDMKKSGGRHQCSICLKHFSSASAVQIHFRTHTGDRPFKCSVCGKAFTTKGNLKVHMGTHMWNGTSPQFGSKQPSHNGSEVNGESHEEEITPVTSPNRANPMALNNINNNNMGWNPFNPNPLMKASMFGNPAAALMANYSGLFLPPGILPPGSEEPSRQWLWPTACHICNKECHTSVALEVHLKSHIVNENGSSKPVTAS